MSENAYCDAGTSPPFAVVNQKTRSDDTARKAIQTNLQPSPSSIKEALIVLLEPGSIAELRVPNVYGKTRSGYFDDQSLLAKAIANLRGKAPAIYVTLNPVRSDLLARAVNRVIPHAKVTTGDVDILVRRWFAIDFDPVRPASISATDAEHEAALEQARQCKVWLRDQGWPDPVFGDSGNGGHLLYRIDLPNDEESTNLVKRCLLALAMMFSNDQAVVDVSTYNAARIWKVYGTVAAKGDNTPDRPHRRAALLDVPSPLDIVSPMLLTKLAAILPPVQEKRHKKSHFDLAAWLSQRGIPVVSEAPWNGGRKWILNPCPWNPEHINKSAYVVQLPAGAIAAGCHHASCTGKDWSALRDLYSADQSAAGGDSDSDQDEGPGSGQEAEKLTQVKHLLSLGAVAKLFHTPDGEAYSSVPVNGHIENWPLKGRRFRQWLLRRYFDETKGAPKTQAVQEAIGIFESMANFEGGEHPVFMRLAQKEDRIYLDLSNDRWEAVEIDSSGWRVLSDVPVRFRRTRGMLPLPSPVRGGNINELRRFVNVASEQDWTLLAAWLVAGFRPRGPYPVLVLHGEQGSAKSTTSRVLRDVLDPNTASLRGEPRDLQNIMIAASNGWVISLDNLSHIPPWLSDALCRLSTGGGFSTRELYTDSEEVIFDAQRPVILNGIEELATRGDLLDRSLILYLPSISEQKRESEEEFWSAFEVTRPMLLGALLDVVSGALARQRNVELTKKPRLADFAVWATAAEPLLGLPDGAFMRAYTQNQSSANDLALEASPVAAALQALALERYFEGTASELLQALTRHATESVRSQRSWPTNGKTLSNTLRRLAPNLRNSGVEVAFLRAPDRGRRRLICVRNVASATSNESKGTDSIAELVRTTNQDASGQSEACESWWDTEHTNRTLDGADAGMGLFDPVPLISPAGSKPSAESADVPSGREDKAS